MGHLPKFEADGFISYARIDNDKIAQEQTGWVEALHRDLSQLLSTRLGKEVRLWLDQHEIRNNEDFSEKISKRLERTAVFLAVVSPAFLQREWTQRELEVFTQHAERHLGVRIKNEKSRIFKVEKVPVNRDSLPKPMQGTGTYEFFTGKPPREFRPQLDHQFGKDYYAKLTDLAHDIVGVLTEMTREPASESEDAKEVSEERLTVYVAETTFDLKDKTDQLRRDLKGRGYNVLPAGDLPRHAVAYKDEVRQCLKQAVLSIHVVGGEYGYVPEGETKFSNLWLQHNLATERAADPHFQRLIWMPSNLTAEGRQREFITHLQEDVSAQTGADLLVGNIEELKTIALGKLDSIRADKVNQKKVAADKVEVAPDQSQNSPDEPLRVYVISEKTDRQSSAYDELCDYLYEQGYELIDSFDNAIEMHAENLQRCDACVIYYGNGSPDWFAVKLDDLRKYVKGRPKPILAEAVYVAPSSNGNNEQERKVRTREAQIIRAGETFSPAVLEPFLQKLRAPQSHVRRVAV